MRSTLTCYAIGKQRESHSTTIIEDYGNVYHNRLRCEVTDAIFLVLLMQMLTCAAVDQQ